MLSQTLYAKKFPASGIVVYFTEGTYTLVLNGYALTCRRAGEVRGRPLHPVLDNPESWVINFPIGFPVERVADIRSALGDYRTETKEGLSIPMTDVVEVYAPYPIRVAETKREGLFHLNISMDGMSEPHYAEVVTKWGHGVRVETRDQNSQYFLTSDNLPRDMEMRLRQLLGLRFPQYRIEPRLYAGVV